MSSLKHLIGQFVAWGGQLTIDALVNAPWSGRGQRISMALLRQVRDILLRLGDPTVSYGVAGRPLALPLSHELPFVRKTYPQYAENASRLADAVARKYPELVAIDIGANVGDTAAIWSEKWTFSILCIEGADEYFALLARNTRSLSNVTLARVFLAGRTGSLSASVNVGHGTGRLTSPTAAQRTVETMSLSDLLKSHPGFKAAKLLKVDTDGMDADILMSEMALFAEARPVILFEYDPRMAVSIGSDPRQVFPALASAGYRMALIYDNTGDYLVSAPLDDDRLLDDLHVFSRHGRYLDICAFHEDDSDLFVLMRARELQIGREAIGLKQPAS